MKKHYLYVPKKVLSRIAVLEKELPEKVRKEHLIYIIDRIIQIPIENRKIRQDCGEWTPLCSSVLQEFGIRHYRRNIDFLLDQGIIDSIEGYQNSANRKRCKQFRLTAMYLSQIVKYKVENRKLSSRLEKNDRFWKRPPKSFNDLSIDEEGALKFLRESKLSIHKKLQAELSIGLIKDKNFKVIRDQFSRRLHSIVTNLRSDLRPFLKWKNKNLVNIDIRNSQPLLASALFNPSFYENSSICSQKSHFFEPIQLNINELYKYNRKLRNTHTLTLPPLILGVLEQTHQDELGFFTSLCSSGRLYESINELVFNSELDRDIVKDKFLWLLFAENSKIDRKRKTDPILKMFVESFPTINECFRLIKEEDHKLLSRFLQTIESYLILEKVVTRINKERPYLPIFTIHDSILTLEGEENYVKHIIASETRHFIGLKPSIKIERLN